MVDESRPVASSHGGVPPNTDVPGALPPTNGNPDSEPKPDPVAMQADLSRLVEGGAPKVEVSPLRRGLTVLGCSVLGGVAGFGGAILLGAATGPFGAAIGLFGASSATFSVCLQ